MSDSEKITTLFKRALGVVSTFKNTPWYSETNIRQRNIVEAKDINIEKAPQTPVWSETSLNYTTMATLGFDLSSSDFPASDSSFTTLHLYSSNIYTVNGERLPGMYLDESVSDSSGVVAFFVRLKLDKMEGDENLDPSAIVYTKCNPSILSDAYEFSYNSQLNVASGIEVFKPYNYTLEYFSPDENKFSTVEHSEGNWIFDNETGVITFEEDPPNINLTNGDLYFTFVKYVGVPGLDNLLCYKDGKIGIGNKNPQSELDISGSVNITGDLDVDNILKISGGTMIVDSANSCVGINKLNPSSTLDVSGNVAVSDSLTITNGVGNGGGFCPIGTIIMWPTINFTTNLFGEWHLCDGTDLSSADYSDLSNVIDSSSGIITLPDFSNRFIKGAKSGETKISSGGSNSASFDICLNHIPVHQHNVTDHTHRLSGNDEHVHQTKAHSHTISDNGHEHQTKDHTHTISDNGHTHALTDHTHNIDDNGHTHVHDSHDHSFDAKHKHNYARPVLSSTQNIRLGKKNSQNSAEYRANLNYSSLNTSIVDASDKYTIDNDEDIISDSPDSYTINVVRETVATSQANTDLVMQESITGDVETTSISASALEATLSISDSLTNSTTKTSNVKIDGNITIDNHQITTDANESTDTISMSCVVNPLFHSLFFFIRIA